MKTASDIKISTATDVFAFRFLIQCILVFYFFETFVKFKLWHAYYFCFFSTNVIDSENSRIFRVLKLLKRFRNTKPSIFCLMKSSTSYMKNLPTFINNL